MGLFDNLKRKKEEKKIYFEVSIALNSYLGISIEDFLNPKNKVQSKEKEVIMANYKLANNLLGNKKFKKLLENHTVCDQTDFIRGYEFADYYRYVKKERKIYSYIKKGKDVAENIKTFNEYIKLSQEDKLALYTKKLHS